MSQKYEREIDEILSRMDESPPARVLTPIRPDTPRPARTPGLGAGIQISPASLMVAALVLAVASSPLQWIYPPAVAIVGILAVICFLGSIVTSLARWRRPRGGPTWRGQRLEAEAVSVPGFGFLRRWRRWRARRRFRDTRWS